MGIQLLPTADLAACVIDDKWDTVNMVPPKLAVLPVPPPPPLPPSPPPSPLPTIHLNTSTPAAVDLHHKPTAAVVTAASPPHAVSILATPSQSPRLSPLPPPFLLPPSPIQSPPTTSSSDNRFWVADPSHGLGRSNTTTASQYRYASAMTGVLAVCAIVGSFSFISIGVYTPIRRSKYIEGIFRDVSHYGAHLH